MTNIDRRSAIFLGTAMTMLASDDALAQGGSDAARNKEILVQAYKRWNDSKGDSVDDWMAIIDDSISFGSLAEGKAMAPFTARVQGKALLKTYFAGLLNNWSMVHYTPSQFIAEGEWVVMVGSNAWRNKSTNKVFDTPKVDVWRMRGGRAIEFYEFYDTAGLKEAAS